MRILRRLWNVTPLLARANDATISPGMSVFFEANLTPGEYVLFCMVTAPDGRSHIEHGMIQQLRIE